MQQLSKLELIGRYGKVLDARDSELQFDRLIDFKQKW
jgi:hypothetical protein